MMEKLMIRSCLLILALQGTANAAGGDCAVTRYGAKPGVIATTAIQAAIDACAAQGGGRVVIPAGVFVTGTLRLKSGINLHLSTGAVLQGSPNLNDYPVLDKRLDDHNKSIEKSGLTDPERLAIVEAEGQRALIYARDVRDVAITGMGTIDGNGEAFWGPGFLTSGLGRPSLPRPRPWIWFRDSERLTVQGVSLINSPSYFLSFETSSDIAVDGVRIRAHPLSPNSDGIQIEGGRDVRIRGVSIRTGDDAIVLKSSNAEIAHVTISDSYLESDDSAFKFGTGSTHPIRHVRLVNTQIVNSRIGIALFMKDGGLFEFLDVQGVNIVTRSRHATDYPIYIDLDRRFPDSKLGRIREIHLSGLRIESRGNILIGGHPDAPIESLRLNDVRFIVRDPVALSTLGGKPRGNMMLAGQQPGADYARNNAHLTLAHITRAELNGIHIEGASAADLGARALLGAYHVDALRLEYLSTGPSSGGSALTGAALNDVFVKSLRLGAGYQALYGFTTAPQQLREQEIERAGASETANGSARLKKSTP
jgi:Glycosyl hydrolases family 28